MQKVASEVKKVTAKLPHQKEMVLNRVALHKLGNTYANTNDLHSSSLQIVSDNSVYDPC
jgi:hypothetical protein